VFLILAVGLAYPTLKVQQYHIKMKLQTGLFILKITGQNWNSSVPIKFSNISYPGVKENAELSLYLTNYHAMKTYLHTFLNSEIIENLG